MTQTGVRNGKEMTKGQIRGTEAKDQVRASIIAHPTLFSRHPESSLGLFAQPLTHLFWREDTHSATILPDSHAHLSQQCFSASKGKANVNLIIAPRDLSLQRCPLSTLVPAVRPGARCPPSYLSILRASVLRSFSSQVSFSSAIIFSVS